MKQIGETLQSLRKVRGLQQKELAEKVGITSKHLSELENGHKEPRYSVLCKLLQALGASIHITAQVPHQSLVASIKDIKVPLQITR